MINSKSVQVLKTVPYSERVKQRKEGFQESIKSAKELADKMNSNYMERKKNRSLMRKQMQDKIDRELKELEDTRVKQKEKREERTKEEHDKFVERLEAHKNERSQRKNCLLYTSPSPRDS